MKPFLILTFPPPNAVTPEPTYIFDEPFNAVKTAEEIDLNILHPDSAQLLDEMKVILGHKMIRTQLKRGYTNEWLTNDWEDECRQSLYHHLSKGDPRDIAIIAMFMIKRNWATSLPLEPLEACSGDVEAEKWVSQWPTLCYHDKQQRMDFFKAGFAASQQSKSLNEAVELLNHIQSILTYKEKKVYDRIDAFLSQFKQ